MNLNVSNNTSFTGAFRVANVTPQIKEGFQALTKDGCKVYYDFAKKSDALIVAPDGLNKQIETLLKKVYSKCFTFYPNIFPEDSLKLIRMALKLAKLPPAKNKSFSRLDGPMQEKIQILKDIGIDVDTDNVMLKMYKGIVKMHDLTNKRQIIMSPIENNEVYVKVLPHSNVEPVKYMRVAKERFSSSPACVTKFYKLTPDEIAEFNAKLKSRFRNYDSEFLKGSNFARTNLELIVEQAISKEEGEALFAKAVTETPELAEKLCADEFSVPTFEALKTLRFATKETQNEMYDHYTKWLK